MKLLVLAQVLSYISWKDKRQTTLLLLNIIEAVNTNIKPCVADCVRIANINNSVQLLFCCIVLHGLFFATHPKTIRLHLIQISMSDTNINC